jgi:hypothetical protein
LRRSCVDSATPSSFLMTFRLLLFTVRRVAIHIFAFLARLHLLRRLANGPAEGLERRHFRESDARS